MLYAREEVSSSYINKRLHDNTLPWVGKLRKSLRMTHTTETSISGLILRGVRPSGVTGGAVALRHGCQTGGDPRSGDLVCLFSLWYQWSQRVCASLGTSGEKAHPKPNALPSPQENYLCSYFSILKIFQYHNKQEHQWTQSYRPGQGCEPTSHTMEILKKGK